MTEPEIRHAIDAALGEVTPEADPSTLADDAEIRMQLDIFH